MGYLLDKDGLRSDPERVKAVLEIPKPKNVKELRIVLGMFGWYSRFIENEAEKKIPLLPQNDSFESLKRALTEAPVLARPDFSKVFMIHADASQYTIGSVLHKRMTMEKNTQLCILT